MIAIGDELVVLTESHWQALRTAHERRVEPWIAPRLRRRERGQRHPVDDFLFEYYGYRPGLLRRWHPGIGVALAGNAADEYLTFSGYAKIDGLITADPARLSVARRESVRWLREFLVLTDARAPQFGCAGLHEWAMVYRTGDIRHRTWPLRLSEAEIATVVERQGLRCTHFDAFRFFTESAQPLNRWPLTRERTRDFEQRGCLHTNMDLYKWAQKLSPFTDSVLVADCFELARAARALDMQASPYDFTALGISPVPIETATGRAQYERAQREISERSRPLRARLRGVCERLIATD